MAKKEIKVIVRVNARDENLVDGCEVILSQSGTEIGKQETKKGRLTRIEGVLVEDNDEVVISVNTPESWKVTPQYMTKISPDELKRKTTFEIEILVDTFLTSPEESEIAPSQRQKQIEEPIKVPEQAQIYEEEIQMELNQSQAPLDEFKPESTLQQERQEEIIKEFLPDQEQLDDIEQDSGQLQADFDEARRKIKQLDRDYLVAVEELTVSKERLAQAERELTQAKSLAMPSLGDVNKSLREIAATGPVRRDGLQFVGGNIDGSIYARKIAQLYFNITTQPIPTVGRPALFQAALRATFPPDPETGRIVREPTRTMVSLAISHGELAAAQEVLYRQVRLIVDDALKVLKGLQSIGCCSDEEKVNAHMAMVVHLFEKLAVEAGRQDRPRMAVLAASHRRLKRELRLLSRALKLNKGDTLNNKNLVTTNEAQMIANMKLLKQYANTLRGVFGQYFKNNADPTNSSFSGRMAYITLLFSVIAGSVRDVFGAMDMAGLSQAERRTTFIDYAIGNNNSKISIDGILTWIEDLVLAEGPEMIIGSGLIGLTWVQGLVKDSILPLVTELNNASSAPHPGLANTAVQAALFELKTQLEQLSQQEGSSQQLRV